MNRHSSTYKLNDQLSLDDLRAYQADQLSGPARHRVERLMLENPFYADALDGLDALQQVGGSLKSQTRDLHIALQERVHESATPRRLMPLWVTSLAASVLLVLSVSVYLIFNTVKTQNQAVHTLPQQIVPGTVLIDPKDLGTSEATAAEAGARSATTKSSPKKQLRQPKKIVQKEQRVFAKHMSLLAKPTSADCSFCAMSEEVSPLPLLELDVPNRRQVNTERAFLN